MFYQPLLQHHDIDTFRSSPMRQIAYILLLQGTSFAFEEDRYGYMVSLHLVRPSVSFYGQLADAYENHFVFFVLCSGRVSRHITYRILPGLTFSNPTWLLVRGHEASSERGE